LKHLPGEREAQIIDQSTLVPLEEQMGGTICLLYFEESAVARVVLDLVYALVVTAFLKLGDEAN
jgi:hypothetical protein